MVKTHSVAKLEARELREFVSCEAMPIWNASLEDYPTWRKAFDLLRQLTIAELTLEALREKAKGSVPAECARLGAEIARLQREYEHEMEKPLLPRDVLECLEAEARRAGIRDFEASLKELRDSFRKTLADEIRPGDALLIAITIWNSLVAGAEHFVALLAGALASRRGLGTDELEYAKRLGARWMKIRLAEEWITMRVADVFSGGRFYRSEHEVGLASDPRLRKVVKKVLDTLCKSEAPPRSVLWKLRLAVALRGGKASLAGLPDRPTTRTLEEFQGMPSLSYQQVAEITGYTKRTIQDHVKKGDIIKTASKRIANDERLKTFYESRREIVQSRQHPSA